MATNRTPTSTKPASKKTTASASTKTPTSTAKAAPKPRASTTTTAKSAKPKQEKLTLESTEPSKPRTPRKAAAKKSVTPEERYQMIARAAYFLAERHGFSSGRALDDWITAEQEVDRMLKSAN